MAREINQSVSGYVVGNLLTSLIAGAARLRRLLPPWDCPSRCSGRCGWPIVDFLPMIGGALAGIPTVLFALAHSLTAGLVTAAVFVGYQQLENHVLNPLIMGKTVKVSPLLVLMSVLLGTSLGDWAGGVLGGVRGRADLDPLRGGAASHRQGNLAQHRVISRSRALPI